MGATRGRSVWFVLAVGAAIGLIVLWSVLRAPEEGEPGAQSERGAEVAALEPESLRPPQSPSSSEADEPSAEAVRVELARDPSTIGPRKTHAKVELVCGLWGTEVQAMVRRVQVLADSDALAIDEAAEKTAFAVRAASGAWVADVTPLVVGVGALPRRLRVVAESERCNAIADVGLSVTPAELAAPSLITLSTSLRFDCPWRVRGRIVAPCPPRAVRILLSSAVLPDAPVEAGDSELDIEDDGRFELRTQRGGALRLEFRAPNAVPLEREFEIVGQGDVELGDVVLEEGSTVAGQLRAAGEPLAFTELAIVRADELLRPWGEVRHASFELAGWIHDDGALQHLLHELGLLRAGAREASPGRRPATVLAVRTDARGRFETSALRPGDHWLIPISSAGRAVWLAPLRVQAPSSEVAHDFDARAVRFQLLDAQGTGLREPMPCALHVVLSDEQRISLGISDVRRGELHALVRPGTLLGLRACGQELLVPVEASPAPLVQSVSPCTPEPALRR